jgi:hypothetical protein
LNTFLLWKNSPFAAYQKAYVTLTQAELYRNGMFLGTWSITSWPFYSSGGYVGMWFVNAPGAPLDNFGSGTR